MGQRIQPRVKGILPVRIWGTDCAGKPFVEHQCTIDISGKGASLAGVQARLSVGDTIGLQYRNRQARFRVVWIVPASTPSGAHVGLECLQPEKQLWPVTLPAEEPDTYVSAVARVHKQREAVSGRRSQARFPVSGMVYVSNPGANQGFSARLGDISLTGCYLLTGSPKAVGHRLKLLIKVAHSEFEAVGIVRVHYPGTAMGMEFTFMSNADRRTLERLIAHLKEFDTVPR